MSSWVTEVSWVDKQSRILGEVSVGAEGCKIAVTLRAVSLWTRRLVLCYAA